MSVSFTRALPVEEGFRPTSTQLKTLARAFNDRLRAFSFCSWRLIWYHFNLWRQIRNPDATGLVFPAQGEFFGIYQHLDPETHQGTTWPETGPGEPEGVNLANPMAQFVFGIADPAGGPGLDNESDRVNSLPFLATPDPTLADLWELGKAQRGVYDPISTAQAAPAFDVAQSFFQVVQPWWSPHGKALGGWLPTPELAASPDCGTTEATGDKIPNYILKWTSLDADVDTSALHGTVVTNGDGTKTVSYAGTCGCGTDNVAVGHVIGYSLGPFGWTIAVVTDPGTCSYVIDQFPINDWIEGPYEGVSELSHTIGNQLQRALWAFNVDFRGTPLQRTPDTFKIKSIAFDNQEFWTRQYALAPNIGLLSGDAIQAIYPRADWTVPGGKTIAQGTFGQFSAGTSHVYTSGFVLGGVFARATKLAGRTSLGIYSNEQLIGTLELSPDATGDAQAMLWLKDAGRPEPLKAKLLLDAQFTAVTGSLYLEATEQFAYKPQFYDAYLVARASASAGGDQFQGGVDGRGLDDSDAKSITNNFFAHGCLHPGNARVQGDWINDNPIFDAARRLSRDHARIMRRQQLVSYEVAGGKSILRFKRFAQYPGIDGIEVRADCFKDIAPPLDPVTTLTEGETYIVRGSGSVTYRGVTYHQDDRFTATREVNFQAHGTVNVYVYDGIRHSALRKGFTNEWTMFLEPRCYHPSGSSIWKPDAYSDYFSWCDRCHFYSGTAPNALRRFAAFNHTTSLDSSFNPVLNPINLQAQMLAPEVPDQFRYSAGANRTGGSTEFYKSCRVYNPPYEIESCVVDDWADDQIIKITLTERLRSHANAPATVAADPTAWSAGDVATLRNSGGTPEDYRTDDNAVREYVLSEATGAACVFRTGDAGTSSSVSGLPDNPFGACYPFFFFSRLIPEPYDDGNDELQPHDSRCLIDSLFHMELATRAICEGFVDGRTSQDIICRTNEGDLYDYTFENLCFEAFGGRWIGAFDLDIRDDNPGGFGPLPSTKMYAEVFNRLVSCVNLLDKMRLDVPIEFQFRQHDMFGDNPVTLIELSGTCTTSGSFAAYGDGIDQPQPDTEIAVSGWSTFTSLGAVRAGILFGCPYQIATSETWYEYRVQIATAFLESVPETLRENIDLGQTGFLAIKDTNQTNLRRETVDSADGDRCPNDPLRPPHWQDGADFYRWVVNTDVSTSECVLVTSGELHAPPLLSSDMPLGRSGGMPVDTFCSNGPSSSAGLTLIAGQTAFIQIPIV